MTLQDYILSDSAIDNAKLLELFAAQGGNKSLIFSMQRSHKARDTHIRYQCWKLLQKDIQAQYTQELTLKAGAEMPRVPQAPEAPIVKEEREIPPKAIGIYTQDWAIQEKARLYRQTQVLSNSLAGYDSADNEGRLAVINEIDVLQQRMAELQGFIDGNEADISPKVEKEYEWLKTDEELAAMSKAEKQLYSKSLSEKRSKAIAAQKKGKDIEKNQRIINTVDDIKSRF